MINNDFGGKNVSEMSDSDATSAAGLIMENASRLQEGRRDFTDTGVLEAARDAAKEINVSLAKEDEVQIVSFLLLQSTTMMTGMMTMIAKKNNLTLRIFC